jgi:hypothetical protein
VLRKRVYLYAKVESTEASFVSCLQLAAFVTNVHYCFAQISIFFARRARLPSDILSLSRGTPQSTMKYLKSIALAAAVSATVLPPQRALGTGTQDVIENELFLLELAPGKTQWATEDYKWELRRVSGPVVV